MATSFNKFSPKKIESSSPASRPHSSHDSPPDHMLDSDLPVTAEEANQLLERVRQEEQNSQKITSLEQENYELSERLAAKDASIGAVLNELSSLRDTIRREALEKVLLDIDDIIKEACHDRIAPIIQKRIDEMMASWSTSSFSANSATARMLGIPIIEEDNSLPDNIVKCSPSEDSSGEFIIEVPV